MLSVLYLIQVKITSIYNGKTAGTRWSLPFCVNTDIPVSLVIYHSIRPIRATITKMLIYKISDDIDS